MTHRTRRTRSLALTAAVAGTLLAAPAAHADAIDDTLAKLPAGQISCDQAQRYWTNDADYNNKVRQAQTIAMFDRRGPQILDGLARVDEAATRCGLKGGGAPAPSNPAPANNAPSNNAPASQAPSNTAAQPVGQLVTLAPQGVPTFDVPVANVATVRLPDLQAILEELLARYGGGSSLPTLAR
ncbi:hypothetical protein [uncultured Corynebacterium sp.]|uniref:hypothetical protein n=1 Tax=uncultured Corynebacterium sp. TaxID=159447 RepID=UPI00259A605A|nr:hypothetical protein [uncultured Corynebacterium sp.]